MDVVCIEPAEQIGVLHALDLNRAEAATGMASQLKTQTEVCIVWVQHPSLAFPTDDERCTCRL